MFTSKWFSLYTHRTHSRCPSKQQNVNYSPGHLVEHISSYEIAIMRKVMFKGSLRNGVELAQYFIWNYADAEFKKKSGGNKFYKMGTINFSFKVFLRGNLHVYSSC